jgi:hypothetical protein
MGSQHLLVSRVEWPQVVRAERDQVSTVRLLLSCRYGLALTRSLLRAEEGQHWLGLGSDTGKHETSDVTLEESHDLSIAEVVVIRLSHGRLRPAG